MKLSTRTILVPLLFGTLLLSTAVVGVHGASAENLSGTLRVASDFGQTPPLSEEALRRERYWDHWNGVLDPAPRRFDPSRQLAVVLRGEGPMAEDQPGFAIDNGALRPSTIVARAETTLQILNTDPCSHQLFAEGHPDFNPTETAPGLTRQTPVGPAGDWPIRDEIYGHVTGHLHALDDLIARAVIAGDGTYRFENVPPGTYTLTVFHGAEVVHTQEGVAVEPGRDLTVAPVGIGGAQ